MRSGMNRRMFLGAAAAAAGWWTPMSGIRVSAAGQRPPRIRPVPPQFIAALAPPTATSGTNAHTWGLWRLDPGPRGVELADYERLTAARGVAPEGWTFDARDWWLEEHGLIMEAPEFPLPAGVYQVTGFRLTRAVLTVQPRDAGGAQRWSLSGGATIHDVTHLGCRSARYTPAAGAGSCSPARARQSDFPVSPGAEMPPVAQCHKQDYAVLIVIGVGEHG